MIKRQGAMSIAEGHHDYKVDCSLALNKVRQKVTTQRDFQLFGEIRQFIIE